MSHVPHLRRSVRLCGLLPGLTAGPIHFRLFEASLEFNGRPVYLPGRHRNQVRSAGSA